MGKIVDTIDMSKYDTFIFDLYGTLIDLHTDEHCSTTWKKWMKWLDDMNIRHPWYPIFRYQFFKLDKEYRINASRQEDVDYPEIDVVDIYMLLFSNYGNELDLDKIEEASYAFRTASTDYIKLFPGVCECLKNLRKNGKKIIILSNAQASYTKPEIIKFGLSELVDSYYISSNYACMKPDKKYYNIAISNENIDVSRAIMIGDNKQSDIDGAIKVGMDAFLTKDGSFVSKCVIGDGSD